MSAQNTEGTPVVGRPWLPGQSGNPGGRPKGLAALIRARTNDGADLVEFHLGIYGNKRAALRYRIEAAAWLTDRGFGKVTLPLEHTGAEGGPLQFSVVRNTPSQAVHDDTDPE